MAVWSEVAYSNVVEAQRIDAEYYQPKYAVLAEQLESAAAVEQIGAWSKVLKGSSPGEYIENGVPVLRSGNLTDIDKREGWLRTAPGPHLFYLQPGDVCISSIGFGSIGKVQVFDYLPNEQEECVTVSEVTVIRQHRVSPYYLAVFLQSSFGQMQIEKYITGATGQLHLYPRDIGKIFVPIFDESAQDECSSLAHKAKQRKQNAKRLYAEAEAILHEALGLDTLNLAHELTYEAQFSDMADAERIDAEHFQPKYARVLEKIKANATNRIVPLESLLTTLTNGHTPLRHDLSIGTVPFLTAEHVYDFRIDFNSEKRVLEEHHAQELAKTQVRSQDLLITIKGRIGNTAVVEELPGPVNINQDVGLFRLQPHVHPYYVAGYINSLAGKLLVEQVCTGQINPFLGLGNLKKLPIPMFSHDKMNTIGQAIAAKVQEAYAARQDAAALLEQAKQRVEALILGG